MQRYLIVGEGVEVIAPEPVREPWSDDPELLAAKVREQAAQHAFDVANDKWISTLHKLAEYRIKAASSDRFNPSMGMWTSGRTHKETKHLEDAELAARQQRDTAGEALVAARVEFRRAYCDAPRAYEVRERLLRHMIGSPCPRCWAPLRPGEDIVLGRSRPTARRDRLQHADCAPHQAVAAG